MLGLGGVPAMPPTAGLGGQDAGQSALLAQIMQSGDPAGGVQIDLPTLLSLVGAGGGPASGLLPPTPPAP